MYHSMGGVVVVDPNGQDSAVRQLHLRTIENLTLEYVLDLYGYDNDNLILVLGEEWQHWSSH